MVKYKDPECRTPDFQYRQTLQMVMEKGTEIETQQGINALTLMAPPPMRFVLENGFPILTERNLAPKESEKLPVTIWRQAVGEIFAFVNGATTLKQLESFGCHWWKDWLTEEKCAKRGLPAGDNGPGSYGGAWAHFPTKDGGEFNQWKAIIEQIKNQPQLRTLVVSPWVPQYIPRGTSYNQQVVVAPCHGWIHIRIINGELYYHMFQRSGDLIVGVPNNMAQHAALALAIGQAVGIPVREYIHSFSDAHIYTNHLWIAEKMLTREPRPFPTVLVNENKKDLFDFRHEDFRLEDYYPHPGIANMGVAI